LFGLAAVVLLPVIASGQTAFSGVVVITSHPAVPSGSYSLTSLTAQQGAVLTIGGGSTVTVSGGVAVTQSLSIMLQSIFSGTGAASLHPLVRHLRYRRGPCRLRRYRRGEGAARARLIRSACRRSQRMAVTWRLRQCR